MDNLDINTIIEITRQRDMDSLELTFIKSLAEIIPANSISIYRSFNGSFINSFDEAFQTSVAVNNKQLIIDDKKLITTNIQLRECLCSASIQEYETNNSIKHIIYPFFIERKVAGAIHIEYRNNIASYKKLIESLIVVYSNHLTVLNDSERDKLTGLLNRRTFDNRLNNLLDTQRCKQRSYKSTPDEDFEKRHYSPEFFSWLAMMDIDDFKNINDTYGHLFGDEVILTLSQQMRQFFRYSDLLFRFGGEEFVVVLEPTTPDMAKQTFERFANVVSNHDFPQINRITISTGYARITVNDYTHVILERADRALYYAKQHGKNCVHNYETLVNNESISERKSGEATTFFDN